MEDAVDSASRIRIEWKFATEATDLPYWVTPMCSVMIEENIPVEYGMRLRILHPAYTRSLAEVRWGEIARKRNIVLDTNMQFEDVVGDYDLNATLPDIFDSRPSKGQLPKAVFRRLLVTIDPDDQLDGLLGAGWMGFAEISTELPDNPVIIHGPRYPNNDECAVMEAHIRHVSCADSGSSSTLPTPNLVCPPDRSWILSTGYDDHSTTFSTKDEELFNSVLSSELLENCPVI